MSRRAIRSSNLSRSRSLLLVWAFSVAILGLLCCMTWLARGAAGATTGLATAPHLPAARSSPAVLPPFAAPDVRDAFDPRLLETGVYSSSGFHRGTGWQVDKGAPLYAMIAETARPLEDCQVYVAGTGSDTPDAGTTTTTPFETISYAISQTGAGDTICVAQGTYTKNLKLDSARNLLGGYDALDWNTRTLAAHATIVDVNSSGVVLDIAVITDEQDILVEGFTFRNGYNADDGGGVRLVGDAPTTLRSNWILNNTTGGDGGGIYIGGSSGTITLSGNTILNNEAAGAGGGIAVAGGVIYAQNDIIADNTATSAGSGVYLSNGTLDARHWTLVNNGDVGLKLASNGPSATLTNTIVAAHDVFGLDGANITCDHTLFFDNDENYRDADCTNDRSGDPKFKNPEGGNYHIDEDSAAFDSGIAAGVKKDIDDQDRPLCGGYDIGADELMPGYPTATFTSPIYGLVDQKVFFTVPVTAAVTGCVDYEWNFGDGSSLVTKTNPSYPYSVPHTYTASGLYTVILTASNDANQDGVTSTAPITISIPISDVKIDGPTRCVINATCIYTAEVRPSTVVTPITYIWQAGSFSQEHSSVYSIMDTVPISWTTLGTQTITVTAANAWNKPVESLPLTVTVTAAAFPFHDYFETDTLGGGWSVFTTAQGQVWLSDEYEPIPPGSYSVILDDSVQDDVYSIAALILAIDLAEQPGAVLDFWWRDFNDNPHPEDGVFISADGDSWCRIHPFNRSDEFRREQIYLDGVTVADQCGWTFNDHFQIKFQFYDNWPKPEDGYAIDNVEVGKIPVASVVITGPSTGDIDKTFIFTATVSPTAASWPITYVWQATGQLSKTDSISDSSHAVTFTWDVTGTKTITVTAANITETFINTRTISIGIPVASVVITGPSTGDIDRLYTFTAIVSPSTATPSPTYTWSPPPKTGQGSAVASYSWPGGGPHTITVTAANAGGTDSYSHTIWLGDGPIPISSVSITGPSTGDINEPYTFTATVSPPTATLPITYIWQATGQDDLEPHTSGVSDTVSFTWNAPDTYTVIVTATNGGNPVTAPHDITITIPAVPVESVEIESPPSCGINTPCTFTATVSPDTAKLPITYTWQATGQSDVEIPEYSVTHAVSFTWNTSGTYTITVTATNILSTATDTCAVTVEFMIYFPLITRGYPPLPPELNNISPNPACDGAYIVSWNVGGGITVTQSITYTLEEATDEAFTYPKTVYNGLDTSYPANNMALGHYYYRVKLCVSCGCSGWSNVEEVDVFSIPDVPTLNSIDNPDQDGDYVISWDAVSMATSYILQETVKATTPTDSDFITVYVGIDTSYHVSDEGPTRYHYRVKARNGCGDSDGWSNIEQVDVQWEHEPNYPRDQANGPLVSGKDYYGRHDDASDYFKVCLDTGEQIKIDLTTQSTGIQLLLYYEEEEEELVQKWQPPYHIEYTADRDGWYYIQVYTPPSSQDSITYTLKVTFP